MESDKVQSYLAQKDDSWLYKLYEYLKEGLEDLGKDINKHKPNYRQQSNEYEKYSNDKERLLQLPLCRDDNNCMVVASDKARFFEDENLNLSPDLFYIKKSTYKQENDKEITNAEQFLQMIGVKPFSVGEQQEYEIEQERQKLEEFLGKMQPEDEPIKVIKKVLQYYKKCKDNYKLNKIKYNDYLFLKVANENKIVAPQDLFLDEPYLSTGLAKATHIHKKLQLDPIYKEKLSTKDCELFIDFLKENKIFYKLAVTKKSVKENPKWKDDFWGRGGTTNIDTDYFVDNLENYLEIRDTNINLLIWDTIVVGERSESYIHSTYQYNRNYPRKPKPSKLVDTLSQNAWLPNRDGNFLKPADSDRRNMHNAFVVPNQNNAMLEAIQFESVLKNKNKVENDTNEKAKSAGFDNAKEYQLARELAKYCKEKGITMEQIKDQIEIKQELIPNKQSKNPNRLQEKIAEQYRNAPNKVYKNVERSQRVSKNQTLLDKHEYLIQRYTTDDEQMACQSCCKEHFKQSDGKYYFEAVEIVGKDIIDRESHILYLQFCPNCAAKYKMYIKKDKVKQEQIIKAIQKYDSLENVNNPQNVSIAVGDYIQKIDLNFAPIHLEEIKAIIQILN